MALLVSAAHAQEPAAASPASAASSAATRPLTIRTVSLRPAHPQYPAELVKAGVQGTTVVAAMLQPDGSVKDWSVQTSSRSPALDEAALNLAKGLNFKVSPEMTSPRPILLPIEFMKDSLTTLDQKTCQDFNTDLAYFKKTFPEKKPEEISVLDMATGALAMKFMQGSKDRQMSFFRSVKPATTAMFSTCEAEPDKKLFEVLLQAVKKEMASR